MPQTSYKNLWTAYYVLIGCLTLFTLTVSCLAWQNAKVAKQAQQRYTAQLVSNSTHQLLKSLDTLLDNLGKTLVSNADEESARLSMQRLLDSNPSFVGFGLALPDGTLTLVSNNIDVSKLPNLKEHPETRESFLKALDADSMVVGRTYFMPALDEWLIPIRKSIQNTHGEKVAVMTAGVRIFGENGIFSSDLHTDPYNRVILYRPADHYLQYVSADPSQLSPAHAEKIYNYQLPPDIIDEAMTSLTQNKTLTLEEILRSNEVYDLTFRSARDNGQRFAAVSFDTQYDLWTISHSPKSRIYWAVAPQLGLILSAYLAMVILFYILVHKIDVAERLRASALVYQTEHDSLTGLANRNHLNKQLQAWIKDVNQPFSVIYMDLDHFKAANDTYGHDFGDEILVAASRRLKNLIQGSGIVIRQSGDEFIIVVQLSHRTRLLALANQVISTVSTPYSIRNIQFILGCSIGIATYPDHGDDIETIMRAADIAMYDAKKTRNSCRIYNRSIDAYHTSRLTTQQRLKHAIGGGDNFYMVYQPKTDSTGQMNGLEALIRWNDDELGQVPPDVFIPIAENSGLMPKLGSQIIDMVFSDLTKLEEVATANNCKSLNVAINISVAQFKAAEFFSHFKSKYMELNSSIIEITVEVTEGLFIEDLNNVVPLLQALKQLGVQISMDDFGTGYSSLSMLRTLPIDELKIDRSFINQLLDDSAAQQMLRHIISIGKTLDMKILAEGVETHAQLELLTEFGCTGFQGYLFSQPKRLAELHEDAKQRNTV